MVRYSYQFSMKSFDAKSFGLGLLSGFVALFVLASGYHVFHPVQQRGYFMMNGGQGGMNTSRMAQRLGISEDELKQELASGKTMQQIAQEHGVTFGRNRQNSGSGADVRSASGSVSSVSSSTR